MERKRIAVIGAGISGLGAAYALKDTHAVTVFEKRGRLGGHANTVDIDYDGTRIAVDTGFIVFNPVNYPNFVPFLEALGVDSFDTDMSFGFSTPGGTQWCSNLPGVFAQKRNLANPLFLGMLADMVRFNAGARADLAHDRIGAGSLGDYLNARKFGRRFTHEYLLPMGAAIWSTTEEAMLAQPAATVLRFFNNHHLLHAKRPGWRTVKGGSRSYVRAVEAALGPERIRLGAPVRKVWREGASAYVLGDEGEAERFDEVILACHSDQALALLADASQEERFALGAIMYGANEAVLHRDTALMPSRTRAWAAWSYMMHPETGAAQVSYWMNALQGLPADKPLFVTLNPHTEPDPALTFGRFQYDHPQFNQVAVAAQRTFNAVQGVRQVWFAGAWLGYGFHEDGLRAGLRVALRLGGQIPFPYVEGDVDGGPWGVRDDLPAPAAALASGGRACPPIAAAE